MDNMFFEPTLIKQRFIIDSYVLIVPNDFVLGRSVFFTDGFCGLQIMFQYFTVEK